MPEFGSPALQYYSIINPSCSLFQKVWRWATVTVESGRVRKRWWIVVSICGLLPHKRHPLLPRIPIAAQWAQNSYCCGYCILVLGCLYKKILQKGVCSNDRQGNPSAFCRLPCWGSLRVKHLGSRIKESLPCQRGHNFELKSQTSKSYSLWWLIQDRWLKCWDTCGDGRVVR
jgi:hypothetical protein